MPGGADAALRTVTVLVGGVSQLYQGDLDLGRLAVERLAGEDLGAGVLVEDFHYGAVAVAQRIEEVRPHALILVGGEVRGRPPGTVERRRIDPPVLDAGVVRNAVAHAVTGYVDIGLVIDVAAGLEVLPARTVAIEVEPACTDPSEALSDEAAAGLEEALDLVRTEVRRVPLLDLAEQLRALMDDDRLEPAPAVEAMHGLLDELADTERHGRWGRTFLERDHLRLRIAAGGTGDGLSRLHWALWWALIEELDRLQPLEALNRWAER